MEQEQVAAPAPRIESSPVPENTRSLTDNTRRFIAAGQSKRANDRLLLPPRFRLKGLSNFMGHGEQVYKAKTTLLRNRSVFIHGECGTGKTHLAVGLLLDWYARRGIDKNESGIFLSIPELFFEIKRCYETNDGESHVLEKYSKMPMLVMDDFGAERITEWSRQIFYLILDRRYREIKQTIFTSNFSPSTISTLIDDRIASRLVEMCEVIKLDGPDRRVEGVAVRQ